MLRSSNLSTSKGRKRRRSRDPKNGQTSLDAIRASIDQPRSRGLSVSISMNPYESSGCKSSLAIGEDGDIDGKVGTTLMQEEERTTGNILVRAVLPICRCVWLFV